MFATTISIKTRLSRLKVAGFFRELPAILSGTAPDPHGVRNAFLGAFCRSMFQSISKAYVAKSKGGADDLGNTWNPLKPKSIAYRLRPKTVSRYPLSSKLWIMQLSQRLLKSLQPGDVVGGRYKPPTGQIVEVDGHTLTFGSDVPYAGRQDAMRRIVPAHIKPWVDKAMFEGVSAMSKKIHNVLTSNRL